MTKYYVKSRTKRGEGFTTYSSLESARRDVAVLKRDPAFSKIRIETSLGKSVDLFKRPQKKRSNSLFGNL